MIVPPVFPCRSVFLFVPVSRSPYSPGLHQAHPQLPVYIRFTIHFRFRFSSPFHVRLSLPVCISLTLSFPFTSGSPSIPDFSFRLRFTCACHSRFASVSPSVSHLHPVHHPLLISLFASVSRVLVSPSLHQSHPQFPIYIRFTIHFRFLFSPTFHVRLSVPVFLLPPFFLFAVLPGAFFPVPSFTFSTFLPSSVTSSMFRLINSSTSDSL